MKAAGSRAAVRPADHPLLPVSERAAACFQAGREREDVCLHYGCHQLRFFRSAQTHGILPILINQKANFTDKLTLR